MKKDVLIPMHKQRSKITFLQETFTLNFLIAILHLLCPEQSVFHNIPPCCNIVEAMKEKKIFSHSIED